MRHRIPHGISHIAFTALLFFAPLSASFAQPAGHALTPRPALVVSTEWLAQNLGNPHLVIIEVTHNDSYARGHIPGARALSYSAVSFRRDNLSTELPPTDRVQEIFSALGVGDSSMVVVYAPEAPMATRVLFTLIANGHDRVAYLDGGLPKWQREGRQVTTAVPQVARGDFTTRPRNDLVVTADWITPRLEQTGMSLVDTRTDGEYVGAGERSGMPSEGHLANARQLEWQHMFRSGGLELLPPAELASLFASRVNAGDTVVTYCWIGYRASATWFVAHHLGYDARFYDGSYQDWLARKLPVKKGATP